MDQRTSRRFAWVGVALVVGGALVALAGPIVAVWPMTVGVFFLFVALVLRAVTAREVAALEASLGEPLPSEGLDGPER